MENRPVKSGICAVNNDKSGMSQKHSEYNSDEFLTNIFARVCNLSVICLESVLFHPTSIPKNILDPKSIRTCPEAVRNIELEIICD